MNWERFPTDEVSLTMLEAACNINPDTEHTELRRFLEMTGGPVTSVSMNGIVYDSVEEALADVDEEYGPPILEIEHEPGKEPHSEHTVIISLIEEIRRLRANQNTERQPAYCAAKTKDGRPCGNKVPTLPGGRVVVYRYCHVHRKRKARNTERQPE